MLGITQQLPRAAFVKHTFSSLILEDSCCNLVTTDVILRARKYTKGTTFPETDSSCKLCPSLSSSQRPWLSLLLRTTTGRVAKFASRDGGLLRLPIRLALPLSAPLPVPEEPSRARSPTLKLESQARASMRAERLPRVMVPPCRGGTEIAVTVGVCSGSDSGNWWICWEASRAPRGGRRTGLGRRPAKCMARTSARIPRCPTGAERAGLVWLVSGGVRNENLLSP